MKRPETLGVRSAWARVIEQLRMLGWRLRGAGCAPDVGTVVMYQGRRHLVKGWLRVAERPRLAPDGLPSLDDMLFDSAITIGGRRYRHCPRWEATHVSAGSIILVSDIEIVGRAPMPEGAVADLRRRADRRASARTMVW